MRPYPLTVLNGGINRLRVKGGASASQLYDLQNAYITNAGSIVPREGTIRAATLNSATVGLAAANGTFNIFSSTYTTVGIPTGYTLSVLQNPANTAAAVSKIWFAKPFMGFEYVVAEFSDNSVVHYWLQNDGTWTTGADYTTASIILPLVANGFAYQAIRHFPPQPLWTPDTTITSAHYVEPNSPTGFAYQAIAVAGSPSHTGAIEPVWPTVAGGIVQEFGDFDQSASDSGGFNPYTTGSPLATSITDRYGDSATISNSGIYATNNATLSSLTLASTKVKTWTAGTTYPPGAVVIPTTNQGAFINAIPNGDLESGAVDWTFTDVGGTINWSIGTGRPYQGTYDLEFPTGSSIGADGAYATMTTGLAVKPGQSVTLTGQLDPNNNGSDLELWLVLRWYDATNTFISNTLSAAYEGGGYRPATVTGVAPANAAFVKAAVRAGSGTTGRNTGYADLLSWNLETPAVITNFLFEAIQPTAAVSSSTEPAWPTVLGNTVIDGGVTWEAIGTSIITWQAIPLMQAGANVPVFPTVLGNSVYDSSSYMNSNGFITTFTSMGWQAISRAVTDTGNPQTLAVTIGASHVFAGDNDICDYSAAVNPIDWSSTNNAGYLPTGLNNYGDNPIAALALYRGNLIVFNAGGYQMWQIDPDPQNMAFLDAQPVGCIWTRSCQSVANDLIFLTEIGVRNLGTIGATANMAIGNTGQPVDPLIVPQLPYLSSVGSSDPYWTSTSLLLPLSSGPIDISLFSNPVTNHGDVTFSTLGGPFPGAGAATFIPYTVGSAFSTGYLSVPVTTGSPLDISKGDFTVEAYVLFGTDATPLSRGYQIAVDWNSTTSEDWSLIWDDSVKAFTFEWVNSISVGYSAHSAVLATPVANTWYYAAATKQGNTLTAYLNAAAGSPVITTGTGNSTCGQIDIGGNGVSVPAYSPNGQIADVRITKGVARVITTQTAAFDLPTLIGYDPLTIYYPGRGQYWLIFGPQVFVLTINGLQGTKSWSRYIFPQVITDATLNSGSLFLRTSGSLVWQLQSTQNMDDVYTVDSEQHILSTIQWPYIDMGALGLNKMLIGVDVVGDGSTTLQIAYDQTDKSTFDDNPNFAISTGVTAPYFVAIDDTVPGQPLPIPINAPSYSLILTFDGGTITTPNNWTWEAANFYLAPQGGGGVTG